MTRPPRPVLAVLAIALLGAIAAAPARPPVKRKAADSRALAIRPGDGFETAPVMQLEGEPYLGANDLARLLGATKFWRADVRKLVLRRGEHRVQLTSDNPFVLIDDRTVWLRVPVRSVRGELQVPVALLDSLPRDTSLSRLVFDPRRGVVALPGGGVIRTPVASVTDGVTRLTFPVERVGEATVAGRARNRFRVRIAGYFSGALPDTTSPLGLVRAIHATPSPGGSAFEFDVSPEAAGWKLIRDENRVVLEFSKNAGVGVEEFAPESPAGPRAIRVVVLDPGHGGADAGVQSGGLVEKDLTLRLARVLKGELERRLNARVLLTRDGDAAPGAEQRAEIANRARADLVLALHFDGYGSDRARGATAWCVPATFDAGRREPGNRAQLPVDVVPWRDVATRWAVPSRALAEAVLSSFSLHGLGPVRLRERMPYPLLGVNAPGLMLECGSLTAAGAPGTWSSDDALRTLAQAIADGVDAYRRNE